MANLMIPTEEAMLLAKREYEKGFIDGVSFNKIIRCKDCKHYVQLKDYCTCDYHRYDILDDDDFCSWAEPKAKVFENGTKKNYCRRII